MKRVTFLILFALLFGGCASSSKLIQRGHYDAAIEKSVKKLRKKPEKEKEIINLERSYQIVNEQNYERIRFLKREANPRSMEEVMRLYTRMKHRQTLVRTVTPLYLRDRVVQFPYIDYDEEIITARSGAAEYYYNQAVDLMGRNDKMAYREAWQSLARVKDLSGDFRDVNNLMEESRYKGISRALVSVRNHSHLNLPPEYEQQLLTVDPRGLENSWVEFYYSDLDQSIYFDYFVVVNLRNIMISPDQTTQSDRLLRKRVEDGFEYVLDTNGNVMKDTLGNDIKIPKYKNLSCTVIETKQLKTVAIEGDIEIFSERPSRLLKREPVGAATKFEHVSARAVGDREALDEETLKAVDVSPLPFPSNPEMIFRTSDVFRAAIAEALRKNRNFIR